MNMRNINNVKIAWLGSLICAFSLEAQTPVVFPLQSMFGQPFSGSFKATPQVNPFTDGTNYYWSGPFGTNVVGVSNIVLNLQPNYWWISALPFPGGFQIYVPIGLGTNPVSAISLINTNIAWVKKSLWSFNGTNMTPTGTTGTNIDFWSFNGTNLFPQ
jgi:hypothetical protein